MTITTFAQLHEQISKTSEIAASVQETVRSLMDLYPLAASLDDQAGELDRTLYCAAPIVAVPAHGSFIPLQEHKHRFLLARDGLYLEVRRPWLHFIHRLAEQSVVAMPFGEVKPRMDLAFGRLGCAIDQMRSFVRYAIRSLPNEAVRHLVWDSQAQQLIPMNLEIEDATPGSVRYRAPALPDHQSLAIDLHSHGAIGAFFSSTDNQDDAGSVKFAGVIGDLDKPGKSLEFRLCVLGLYLPVRVPADQLFGG